VLEKDDASKGKADNIQKGDKVPFVMPERLLKRVKIAKYL
jgi:hypothetical protein